MLFFLGVACGPVISADGWKVWPSFVSLTLVVLFSCRVNELQHECPGRERDGTEKKGKYEVGCYFFYYNNMRAILKINTCFPLGENATEFSRCIIQESKAAKNRQKYNMISLETIMHAHIISGPAGRQVFGVCFIW